MDGNEKLLFTDSAIFIEEDRLEAVMHDAEKELMCLLADIVTRNGGDILEIGFGLNLSADAIQRNAKIKSHTIIEVHPEIYKKALNWAKDKPNTRIILGDWFDILPKLNDKFDGILHDTHRDKNLKHFLNCVKSLCKKDCVVCFFTNPYPHKCLNTIYYTFKDEDFNRLPYKSTKKFHIKHTQFDGKDFYNPVIY